MANGNFGGGDGSELSPFLVEDAQDLDAVRNNLFAHYKQTKDIDLSSYADWQPIGSDYIKPFVGIFDGNNKVIRNLKSLGYEYSGLLGSVSNCEIKNISLENIEVSAIEGVGGLLGEVNGDYLKLNNCHVTGISKTYNADSGGNAGGLIGSSWCDLLEISECSFKGSVTTYNYNSYCGGLIGYQSGYDESSFIKKSFFEGKVTAYSGGSAGGILGCIGYALNLFNCYSIAEIEAYRNPDSVSNYSYGVAGGISAECYDANIENCYFKGTVRGNAYSAGISPIAAYSNFKNSYVISSFIEAVEKGIALENGYIGDLTSVEYLEDLYSIGNCYSLDTLYGIPIQSVARITEAQSLLQDTYTKLTNWDFKNVWEIKPGQTPTLKKVKRSIITCKRVPLTNYRR